MRLPVFLRYLVFFLPVLVVSFAVLMGAAAIARVAGDDVAQWMMNSAAVGVLLLLAVDVILLVGALGIKSLMDVDQEQHRRMRMEKMMKHRRGRRRKGGRGRGRQRRHRDHDDHGERE